MVGRARATHLCAHAHSEDGNLSIAVEWLSDFGRVATIGPVPLPVIGASLTGSQNSACGRVRRNKWSFRPKPDIHLLTQRRTSISLSDCPGRCLRVQAYR